MKLNPVFSNGCVFQASKPIRVFGTGAGTASVTMNGCTAKGVFDAENWLLELPAQDYGGPYEMTLELNGEKAALADVYVGEVILAGGQSNMELKLSETVYDLNRCADDPLLRLYTVDKPGDGEFFTSEDGWVRVTRENAPHMTALGYIAARKIREETGCAVGIIACYQGAAAIQTFLPEKVFEDKTLVIPDEDRFDLKYPWNPGTSRLYHAMLERIAPYSVGSAAYYQGESNSSEKESAIYGRLLDRLISCWRELFRDEKLHFIIVQLADYLPGADRPWKRIQQAQAEADTWENVDTVICRDICENDMIHPAHKEELALRIAEKILHR